MVSVFGTLSDQDDSKHADTWQVNALTSALQILAKRYLQHWVNSFDPLYAKSSISGKPNFYKNRYTEQNHNLFIVSRILKIKLLNTLQVQNFTVKNTNGHAKNSWFKLPK